MYLDNRCCFSGVRKSSEPIVRSLRFSEHRFERKEHRRVGGHHPRRLGQRPSRQKLHHQLKGCHQTAVQEVQQRVRTFF